MTWIIEIMSNVKGHKNKPSIFKSKKATRQPSNLCPPPLRPSQWLLISLTHCNVTMIFSLSHTFFFWRTVYFEFRSNNMEGSVLEKKLIFSCITLYFAKMDRTYSFFFLFSLPNSIYHSLCKMPLPSFLWHSQSFYSFHPTGTREEVKCHALRLLMLARQFA